MEQFDTVSEDMKPDFALSASMDTNSILIFFTYLTDEGISLTADITDNFVETNYAVQDHIAIKPRQIRLKGVVGEITFDKSVDTQELLKNSIEQAQSAIYKQTIANITAIPAFVNGLTTGAVGEVTKAMIEYSPILNAFLPQLSNYTNSAIQTYRQVESSVLKYANALNVFKTNQTQNSPVTQQKILNIQKKVVNAITNLFNNRIPVSVAGFAYHEYGNDIDKALWHIQSVNIRQTDSLFISDIEVVLKEIRIAETKYTKIDSSKYANPTVNTDDADKGDAPKEKVNLPKVVENIKEKAKKVGWIRTFYYGARKVAMKVFDELMKDAR